MRAIATQSLLRAAPAACLLLATACGRFDARMELKAGNREYKEGKFEQAVEHYAKVPAGVPERIHAALNTGYSHMAQYRFGSKHPKDQEHAKKAVELYEEYLTIRPTEAKAEADLPDADKIEEWIVTLLVDSDRFDDAIARLDNDLRAKPKDAAILRAIASTYDKWKRPVRALEYFEKWAVLFPSDPAPHAAIAAYCWNVSYRGGADLEPLERNRWIDHGVAAADMALKVGAENFEALTYKNLLIRERAKMRIDPDVVSHLVVDAQVILEKAKEVRKKLKEAEEAAKAKEAATEAAKTEKSGA